MGNKRVPEIRFAGFTGDWEERKLGEVISELYNGQTPSRLNSSYWNGEINWLSSGELNRGTVVKTIEKITKIGMDKTNLKIVPKGTFVMAITGLEAAGTRGNCAILGINSTLNQSCMALYPNPIFLETQFLFQWYRKVGELYGIKFTQGTKQQSYNAELIKELPIDLPSVEEQTKIGNFFKQLDDMIALHKQELTSLKQTKQGFLQKMFPKQGDSVPEVRFPGFTGDWEQRKLGDVSERVRGNDGRMNLPTLTISARSGWLDQRERFSGNIAGKEQKNYTLLSKGELSYNHGNSKLAKYGAVFELRTYEEALVPRVYHSFKTNEKASSDFIEYMFATKIPDRELAKLISSGARMDGLLNINYDEFMSIKITIPKVEEQMKIAKFLRRLDDMIAIQQRELDALKETKKAFLQKMFV